MVERFNCRVNQILKPIYFKDRQTLADTLHKQVNHYNHEQVQPAPGALTPLEYSNQGKDLVTKLKGKSPNKEEPERPEGTCVKVGRCSP